MNLQTLSERATKGEVRELELLSLEGGFYLARVRFDHGQFTLLDDTAKPLHLRSVNHLRELLQLVPPFPCVLVQHCVHDEMCGSRDGPVEPMRIPFSLAAPW
ncbi:hypothetical protein SAMN04490202_5039 [Pseudomonas reinekei]|uniref:Metal ABC transporter ATPase n=1 Tax=Pseudomonas reinekei TaxID=395598 RepID=A0A1H0TZP5_PSERE|nr:DUF6482 family protein [Pseudomonas reinekei]KAB0488119.1 metal ABC transporter ATPase [Pseudomonas reinekei]OLU05550.1 metal ABC transporter ATPase [Pseudomonas reinekei]SDP59409.1 hypothetical protein SAMN04490202_5039 [Pseudomonas reinekei]